jgi:hypothetical protein
MCYGAFLFFFLEWTNCLSTFHWVDELFAHLSGAFFVQCKLLYCPANECSKYLDKFLWTNCLSKLFKILSISNLPGQTVCPCQILRDHSIFDLDVLYVQKKSFVCDKFLLGQTIRPSQKMVGHDDTMTHIPLGHTT